MNSEVTDVVTQMVGRHDPEQRELEGAGEKEFKSE